MNENHQPNHLDYVNWFRQSSPYINAHRGKTFVVMLSGEALAASNFANIVHDIALLNSLGVRLVLVHGARPQIEARLHEKGLESLYHRHLRITDEATLGCVKEAVGSLRSEIEARFSLGLPNSPMHGASIRVCSGNFVKAKPLGVVEGVDLCHTGEVRRIDTQAIDRQLKDNAIVLLSNLGYSPSGEVFNLSGEEVAVQTAVALQADKLICFGAEKGITNSRGERVSELLTRAAERLVAQYQARLEGPEQVPTELARQLQSLANACRGGVKRGHLLSYQEDGALLIELFSRDGAGTMVLQESYEQVRAAGIDDVAGLLELIQPLEEAGVLVRRSRELLENEIERFTVIDLDGTIIGCAALYPFEDKSAELACVAVHGAYRGGQRGDNLLQAVEDRAREQGIERLFVLTTRTAHWFVERGFAPATREALPDLKQQLYNLQRNSKVFEKRL